jgi:hypothetical protein
MEMYDSIMEKNAIKSNEKTKNEPPAYTGNIGQGILLNLL